MISKDRSGVAGTALLVVTLLACCAFIAAPAAAVTKYPDGAPSFTAAVYGVNEFSPGENATISILLKNSGLNTVKQLDRGTIEPEDLPNTAKFTTISLGSAGDAVLIKTDPQMIGDIRGNGNAVIVRFNAKISANATEGEYVLPLALKYRYATVVNQDVADIFQFTYDNAEETLPLTIRIKPHVKIEVVDLASEPLSAGSEGYLNLTIRNAGREDGEMAVVKLLRNGQSQVIPAVSSVFIGSFRSGDTVTCRYKVSVAKDAMDQDYPIDIVVTSTNREGSVVSSAATTVGVPVHAKPAFTVVSPVPEVPAGSGKILEIQYRNNGAVTIYAAQARITPHDPLTISDNTAFIGDLKPGETAIARYDIQAGAGAEPKVYSFDSNIRYRDALGTSQESETIPVQVTIVTAAPGISAVSALAAGVLAALVIGIAFLIYRQRKESR
jgi:hypothetical protein